MHHLDFCLNHLTRLLSPTHSLLLLIDPPTHICYPLLPLDSEVVAQTEQGIIDSVFDDHQSGERQPFNAPPTTTATTGTTTTTTTTKQAQAAPQSAEEVTEASSSLLLPPAAPD